MNPGQPLGGFMELYVENEDEFEDDFPDEDEYRDDVMYS